MLKNKILEVYKNFNGDLEFSFLSIPIIQRFGGKIDCNNKEKSLGVLCCNSIRHLYWHKIVEKHNLKNIEYIFSAPTGLGDTFFLARYLERFKKENGNNVKIGVLLQNDKTLEMLKCLNGIDKIIIDEYYYNCLRSKEHFKYDIKPKTANFIRFPSLEFRAKYFAQMYPFLLNVKDMSPLQVVELPKKHVNEAMQIFDRLNCCPKNTIILSPFAQYFDYKVLPEKFWFRLANSLIKEGYNVVFNTRENVYSANYPTCFPDKIMTLIAMISLSSALVSFRAGLNDVCAGFGIQNQILLYPDDFRITQQSIFDIFRQYHEFLLSGCAKECNRQYLFNFYSLISHFKNYSCEELFANRKMGKNDIEQIIKIIQKGKVND